MPPDIRQATFFPFIGTLSKSAAATETAPAPSATNFCFSIRASIAVEISSSVTVTISSTYFSHRLNVVCPGVFTAIPSAMVLTERRVQISCSALELIIDGAPAACTPYIFILGFKDLMAKETPLISPPPPMGIITASTSGSSSNISNPIVPCPAMTKSSSKGCIKVAPVSFCISNALL